MSAASFSPTPVCKIEVEGHTDSVGSEEFNQQLSEQRAGTVRDYLVGRAFRRQSPRGIR